MNNQQQITIRLHCVELPGLEFDDKDQVRLGIQKGKVVIDDVLADVKSVIFTCHFRVEKDVKTGKPNFLGPYAQGTPQERFIYLCWGERKGAGWEGFRRAKIHLKNLAWQTVEKSIASGKPIEAVIKMTDKKGAPLCASVKPDHITWKL